MLPPTFQPVIRLPRNQRGRDFVVGDLHGTHELLMRALARVGFDRQCDRLLATGDLVDRGPDSAACVEMLDEFGVFSARGNHEQMALDAFRSNGELALGDEHLPWLYRNGLGWWLGLTPAQRLPLLRRMARLPLVLEVDTARGTVGVLHADVPQGMDWPRFLERIEALDSRTVQICLWGRQRIEGEVHHGVPGVGRIFVGHTPQWGQLRRFGNIYAVDTGAVFGHGNVEPTGALTLAHMTAATAPLVAPRRPVQLVSILDDNSVPLKPFSQGPGYTEPAYGLRMPLPRKG